MQIITGIMYINELNRLCWMLLPARIIHSYQLFRADMYVREVCFNMIMLLMKQVSKLESSRWYWYFGSFMRLY